MPPYNARSGENRRKAHRALLIGVDRYEHLGRLPSVPRNLELMKEALTAEGSGVFDPDEVRVLLDPRGRHTVDAALSKAAEEAEGLLVVYFVGHGQVDTYGRNFHLMVAGSKVTRDKSHPFSNALAWHKDVMHWLWESEAEHIVVILDCCYAGNALKELDLNPEKRFALFAAIREGAEIPVARSAGGTRFTREIHRVLTEEPAEGDRFAVATSSLRSWIRGCARRWPASRRTTGRTGFPSNSTRVTMSFSRSDRGRGGGGLTPGTSGSRSRISSPSTIREPCRTMRSHPGSGTGCGAAEESGGPSSRSWFSPSSAPPA